MTYSTYFFYTKKDGYGEIFFYMLCWVLWSSIQTLIAIDSPGLSSSFSASFCLTAGFSSYKLQRPTFLIAVKVDLSDFLGGL